VQPSIGWIHLISNPSAPLGAESLGRVRATTARTGDKVDPARGFTALAQVVRESGLLERARWFYVVLMIGLGLALLGAGVAFVVLGDSWWQLVVAAVLGILFTQFAFFSHEAAHRQVLSSGPANDRAGLVVGTLLVGMSYSWWMNKHTRHHANPNQVGKDPDIAGRVVAFTEEKATNARGALAIINQRQGWLFFPLLLLEGLNLYVQSYAWLLSPKNKVKSRVLELVLMTVRFAVVFGAAFWFLSPGLAVAFLAVSIGVFGFYMGAAFAPNHIGMPIIPAGAKLDFLTKQVLTSRNIRGGFWASVLYGGLNYQVEHHLFPSMARVHLARTRVIVREHCSTLDIPYTETSIRQAYAAVIEYLDRVGAFARDPFTCPVVGLYRRT